MSGCGCGGGCGTAAKTSPVQPGTYARPQFFAGQLLTEADLEALSAYVAGKNRLHNRYLVGAGVVCGLGVRCAGKGSGEIVVTAGYALDCCGNDIVVPCDTTVDVTALIADLPLGATDTGQLGRTYELRIAYAERPTDLVAPYTSGDDIVATCEPTRFQEGYRFSLVPAPVKRASSPSLVERLVTGELVDPERQRRITAMESIAGGKDKDPDGPEGALKKIVEARAWYLANRVDSAATQCGDTGPDVAGIRPDAKDPGSLQKAARTVADGLRRDASAEICAAIAVTCQPCCEDAVPLAVLTVAGCVVTGVCEYVRRPALTGPALRSWLPVDWLFEQAERFCCGDQDAAEVAGLIGRVFPARDLRAADPLLRDGEQRILRMLNSQVQGLQARIGKLEALARKASP